MTVHKTPPPALAEWVAQVAPDLGVEVEAVPVQSLLDLTRDVAHGVMRPAGPVTTYLLGVAVAQGMDAETARARVAEHVQRWQQAHPPKEERSPKEEADGEQA